MSDKYIYSSDEEMLGEETIKMCDVKEVIKMADIKNLNVEKINGAIKEFVEKMNEILAESTEETEEDRLVFKFFNPKIGDIYYAISSDGDVYDRYNSDTSYHTEVIKHGVFETKEQAEFYAERQKVMRELDKFVDVELSEEMYHGDGYICIQYSVNERFSYERYYGLTESSHIFSSVEQAIKAVNAVGEERLKKYYFLAGDNS